MTWREELAAAARTGGDGAAVALVEARAAAGMPEALLMLGQWRLFGLYGPCDHAAAHRAIAAAAERGSAEAAQTLSALVATGTGTRRDPAAAAAIVRDWADRSPLARRQADLLAAMTDAVPAPVPLCADPMIARLPGLLSLAECDWLIERAAPIVRPSLVIDPQTGRRVPHPVRDSHGGNFAPPDEDIVIHAINRRIAAATSTEWEQGEPLHILRYVPGQQYRPHIDALPGVANQRVLTVLIYLNDDYGGGATGFSAGPEVRGARGDAVVFANTDAEGRPDARTRHAGLPVTHGVKWLATRWIRARPFDPWGS